MTPPGSSFHNFLLGRTGPVLERSDLSGSVTQLQALARLSATTQAFTTTQRSDTATRLLLNGTGPSSDRITSTATPYTDEQVQGALDAYVNLAHGGSRRSYYDAMRTYFVMVHRLLNNDARRSEVPGMLHGFIEITRAYRDHLAGNASLQPEERMRYLYAAAGVVRNMLGRVQSSTASQQAAESETPHLLALLGELYQAILSHERQHLIGHPNGEAYTTIVREIQMRQAILSGNQDVARQRALELASWLTAHPPPPDDPNDPNNNRWDYWAARDLIGDPEFTSLVRNMDAPSAPENTIALLNGVSYELVQTVAATFDQMNEDSEATITARYRPLASVVSILTLTRPSETLSDILSELRDPAQASAIRQEIENAAHDSPEVNRVLTEARGDIALDQWITRARDAAGHVDTLRRGAAGNVMTTIFDENRRLNRINDLAESLGRHPGLLESLGVAGTDRANPVTLRRMAIELYRRGPLGVSALQEYGNSHPDDSVQGLIHQLQTEENPQGRINELVQEVISSYQIGLNQRPDHELAAVHSVAQLISQTTTVSEGISIESANGNRSRTLVNNLEGYGFRTRRALTHLSSGSSLATLGAGILLAETLPAALIARAGTSGRVAAPLVGDLVTAGRLTGMGSAVTGISSGLAMSLIGTGLSTRERARLGMRTHFWRDFGESAATNTVVFGLTIPFARGLSRALTPAAEEGNAITQLSFVRRFGIHAASTLFGGTAALGMGSVWRGVNTGHWGLPSYDEVAENYLSILAYEGGSAAFRRFRTRVGLSSELQGRPVYEAIQQPLPEPSPAGAGRLRRFSRLLDVGATRAGNGISRGLASALNTLFTNLGPYRAARITTLAGHIVDGMPVGTVGPDGAPQVTGRTGGSPHLAAARAFIARQLALRELSAPGSLDEINENFLLEHRAFLRRRGGSMVLEFDRTTTPQAAPEGYNADLLAALRRHHIDNASSTDPDYLPRFLPGNPFDLVELQINPETGNIVGINGHSLGETDGSVVVHASYDPQTRELRLPPLSGETAPQVLQLAPMLDAHRSSPLPMLWTAELGARVLTQRLDRNGRARVNISIDDLNRSHPVELLFNCDTGEILNNVRLRGDGPSNILRLIGRYDADAKTVTFSAPRGQSGDYVLNMENGRIVHQEPEAAAGSRSSRRGSTSLRGSESRASETRRSGAAASGRPRPEADGTAAAVAEAPEGGTDRSSIDAITSRSIQNAHLGVITTPGAEGEGAQPITVYFGRRSGRILGVSSGHEPVTSDPEHLIVDHFRNGNVIPARGRVAYHGELSADRHSIALEVPASEGQEAGTLTLDLRVGTVRFQVRSAPPPGDSTPPPPPGGPISPAAPAADGTGNPPATAPAGARAAEPAVSSDGIDDNAITGRHAAVTVGDTTGPQQPIPPTEDVHASLDFAEILQAGESRSVIDPNIPGGRLREGQHYVVVPGVGDVSAFTEVGLSKHSIPRNEDAYGIAVAGDGSLVVVVADGAGGSSTGEAASAQAVQTVLELATQPTESLGSAFRTAHSRILSDLVAARAAAQPPVTSRSDPRLQDSYTVATALRIPSDGPVEVATVGDSQVWVGRPRGDGDFDIFSPYLPASTVGLQRAGQAHGVTNTLEMNAASGYILSQLGGAPGAEALPITSQLQHGLPMAIYNSELTLAGPNGERTLFTPQAGDLFFLMSDGISTLFNRQQFGEAIRGTRGADEPRRAIQAAAISQLDLFRSLSMSLMGTERRTRIGAGSFEGNYINEGGRIYDAETGGNLVGTVNPDNMVLLVVHYNPNAGAEGQ